MKQYSSMTPYHYLFHDGSLLVSSSATVVHYVMYCNHANIYCGQIPSLPWVTTVSIFGYSEPWFRVT